MNQLTFYLQKLLDKQTLTKSEAFASMQLMMEENNVEQTAAFLTLLKYRGETAIEIVGMIEAIKHKSQFIELDQPVLDIVGTGGDLSNTINISTGSAILIAACGIPVVKHGNRALSSQCGSADVLEKLGVNIEMSNDQIKKCLKEINIGFIYAPLFHPVLQTLRPIRKAMKIPTVFNLLGPLLNPANAEYILIGVAQDSSLDLISDVILKMERIKKALIFHGCGLDELTTLGKIAAYEIIHGKKQKIEINPVALGLEPCQLHEIQGGNVEKNASLLLDALANKNTAIADTLILNAGVAIKMFGKARSIKEGILIAQSNLINGKALELLERWIKFSTNLLREK